MKEPPARLLVLAERLRLIRKRHGLTQAQVAARAQISQIYVSALERGKHEPRLLVAERLCHALGMSVSEWLDEAGTNVIPEEEAESVPKRTARIEPKRHGRR